MVELEGELRSLSELLDTDQVDDIVRENLVVIGSVLEVKRKETLRTKPRISIEFAAREEEERTCFLQFVSWIRANDRVMMLCAGKRN